MPLLGAGISAVGSLVGGLVQGHAAGEAAKQQAATGKAVAGSIEHSTENAVNAGYAGINQANTAITGGTADATKAITAGTTGAQQYLTGAAGTQGDIYKSLTGAINPYQTAGAQGINQMATAMAPGGSLAQQFSFNPQDLENDPGYQFQMQQGLKQVQASAAARGMLSSGSTLKGTQDYAQGLAGTSYQNAYNRAANTFQMNQSNTLNALNALAGYGQNANNQLISAGSTYGNQVGQNAGLGANVMMQGGQSLANTAMQGGQSLANTAMQGNQYIGNVGLQGAEGAGQALMGAANAQSAGTIGAANAWQGALGGVANAANMYNLTSTLAKPNNTLSYYNPAAYGYGVGNPVGPANPLAAGQALLQAGYSVPVG
jgi:hypothetical protein